VTNAEENAGGVYVTLDEMNAASSSAAAYQLLADAPKPTAAKIGGDIKIGKEKVEGKSEKNVDFRNDFFWNECTTLALRSICVVFFSRPLIPPSSVPAAPRKAFAYA